MGQTTRPRDAKGRFISKSVDLAPNNCTTTDPLEGNVTLARFTKAIQSTFWMTARTKKKAVAGLRREALEQFQSDGDHSFWNDEPNALRQLFAWHVTPEGWDFWNSIANRAKI